MKPSGMAKEGDQSDSNTNHASTQSNSSYSMDRSNHYKIGTIVGIIVATIVALLACLGAFLLWRRHRKMKQKLSVLRNGGTEGGQGGRTSVVGA